MPLSGLEIYKLLPRTNCKDCGFPTCLAFAMKLAAKQVDLSACPAVSEETKQKLAAASQPPIRLVTIGTGERAFAIGNETVLFRHDKTFYHEPGLVVRVAADLPADEFKRKVNEVAHYTVERVGSQLVFNGVAVQDKSGDAAKFAEAAAVAGEAGALAVLISDSVAAMTAALARVDGQKPLVYAGKADSVGEMAALAKRHGCPLAVAAPAGDLSALAGLTEEAVKAGVEDIVLDPGTRGHADSLSAFTQLRRLALRQNFRALGYPIIAFPGEGAESELEELSLASMAIAKYAGVIVLDHFSPTLAYPLLTLRQNIYTDPQKPIQVKPGLYQIGEPDADSPLFVTTNFSLTYFSVQGEVEGCGTAAWLLVTDSEGLSVLTAWAAGKFDAERIAKAIKSEDVESKISHRRMIIPGLVAVISGELEDELPGWEIMVGPREAVDITSYMKTVWCAI